MAENDPLSAALAEIRADMIAVVNQVLHGLDPMRAAGIGALHGRALKALDAVDAALRHHQRVPLYGNAATADKPGNCPHDPERDWDCHFESDDGEWLCEGKPEGAACSCGASPDGERTPWPCDEVADILAALKGGENPNA